MQRRKPAKSAGPENYDEHDQPNGEHEGKLDIVDRGSNRRRTVEHGLDRDRGRNIGHEARKLRLDLVNGLDDVGARLLVDRQHDSGCVVLKCSRGPVGCGGNSLAYIANSDWGALAIGDDRVVELLGLGDLIVRGEREIGLGSGEGALGRIGG